MFKQKRHTFIRIMQLFVFACLITACTQNSKPLGVQSFTLDNGLQVIIIENHRAPVVSHMIWYKTGAADEDIGVSGVAHFFEHLMFKGTDNLDSGEFSKIVQRNGGNDNAFTGQNYTAYYQNISVDHLGLLMEMEADRMKHLALTKDLLSAERDVILEERRQRTDNNPQAKFREKMNAALFPDHPYGIPVIGWKHEIEGLELKDALYFYKQWYAPNNAIVIIAGDVTKQSVKKLVEKHYGSLKSVDLPTRKRPAAKAILTERRIDVSDPQAGTILIQKSYLAPRGNEALELADNLLGGETSSNLYKELVVNKKLATFVNTSYDPITLGDATFSIYASPTPNTSAETLESAINDIIEDFLTKGIDDADLMAAKNRLIADTIFSQDSLQAPALLFGRALTSGFDLDYIQNWEKRISAVTKEDILKAANDLFHGKSKPVTGILRPNEKDTKENLK